MVTTRLAFAPIATRIYSEAINDSRVAQHDNSRIHSAELTASDFVHSIPNGNAKVPVGHLAHPRDQILETARKVLVFRQAGRFNRRFLRWLP